MRSTEIPGVSCAVDNWKALPFCMVGGARETDGRREEESEAVQGAVNAVLIRPLSRFFHYFYLRCSFLPRPAVRSRIRPYRGRTRTKFQRTHRSECIQLGAAFTLGCDCVSLHNEPLDRVLQHEIHTVVLAYIPLYYIVDKRNTHPRVRHELLTSASH